MAALRCQLIASTDRRVSVGAYWEVLSHEPGAITMDRAVAALLNHNPDYLVGRISSKRLGKRELLSEIEVMQEARARSGVSIANAVRYGALAGVSIGYSYRSADCRYDEATNTLYVDRWNLHEITLTPIPADTAARVTSWN